MTSQTVEGSVASGPKTRWISPDQDAPMRWLTRGWEDYKASGNLGLGFGIAFVAVSWTVVLFLISIGLSSMILPAAAGGMLAGPLLATGLYAIGRRADGTRVPSIAEVWTGLGPALSQLSLLGAVLMILLLGWLRAATIIFALHFGLVPLGGFWDTALALVTTATGWSMLIVGTFVGGLFAAFTFAISVFSAPMLIDRDVDAFTAMGRSFSAVTHNAAVMIRWGVIVTVLFAIGFGTLLIGMAVIFPVLGFATWRAYEEVFGPVPESAADAPAEPAG